MLSVTASVPPLAPSGSWVCCHLGNPAPIGVQPLISGRAKVVELFPPYVNLITENRAEKGEPLVGCVCPLQRAQPSGGMFSAHGNIMPIVGSPVMFYMILALFLR